MMMLRRLPTGVRSVLRPACSSAQLSTFTSTPKLQSSSESNKFQLTLDRKYQTTGPILFSTDDSSLSYSERQGMLFLFASNDHYCCILSNKFASSTYDVSAKKGRPVSPHVQVYAFPITAISSITNRITGVALSVGNILIMKMIAVFLNS